MEDCPLHELRFPYGKKDLEAARRSQRHEPEEGEVDGRLLCFRSLQCQTSDDKL
jgi:hypothetical protein